MASYLPIPPLNLPSYSTLCVTGPYAAPTPIYMCVQTYMEDPSERPVLLVTPSRGVLSEQLTLYNDNWLSTYSGTGNMYSALSSISLLSCPTVAHWLALMANLRVAENSSASFDGSLARSPSLIVLHEPSSLLLHDRSKFNLSSYCALVTSALSASSSLSNPTHTPRVALFDSKLDSLQLPIVKSPELGGKDERRLVLDAVLRYFHYHASCEALESDTLSDLANTHDTEEEPVPTHRVTIHEILRNTGAPYANRPTVIRSWTEEHVDGVPWSSSQSTKLIVHGNGREQR